MTADVVVAGQLARDLVLVVDDVPEAGQSRPVRERREMPGGAPPDGVDKEALLSSADVVQADAREAELLTGDAIHRPDDAARAAAVILGQGPTLVALAVGEAGNYFAWRDPVWGPGNLLIPLARTPVADTTGAGDAFTAALIAGLDKLQNPEEAARLAVAAAGLTVGHPGGRPELSWARLKEQLAGE